MVFYTSVHHSAGMRYIIIAGLLLSGCTADVQRGMWDGMRYTHTTAPASYALTLERPAVK